MKSVLVDFYNLHLRPSFIEEPTTEQLRNGQIFTTPDEDERRRIISFFEIYASNVLRKLTSEAKRQIRDFEAKIYESQKEDVLQVILENKKVFVDNYTTLEGYDTRNEISWFESHHFHLFAGEYQYFKDLIDKLINGSITVGDLKALEVRRNEYIVETLNMEVMMGDYEDLRVEFGFEVERNSQHFDLGIYFGELFQSIYDEAISVLKGDLPVQKCKRNDCNNILLKSGNRKYCSKECSREAKRENDRQRGSNNRDTARNHQMLCDLIELWLKLSGNDEWLKEVKCYTGTEVSMLKNQLKGEGKRISARKLKEALEYLLTDMQEIPVERLKKYLTDRERNYISKYANGKIPFLGDNVSASSLAGLLKEVEDKLKKEKGIDMNPEKLTKSGKKKKWYTYQFMIKR